MKTKEENNMENNKPMRCWFCNKETEREELRVFKRRKVCFDCFMEDIPMNELFDCLRVPKATK